MNYNDILGLIGNTPLVKINKINPNPKVNIYAKLEGQNPTGSVKDRIALQMIEDLEREGKLKPDNVIIEPTSGNTGIGIAFVCAVKGYKCKIVMPEHVSVERRQIISAFGAELILCKKEEWRDAAIKLTKGLCAQDKNLVMPNQFESPSNARAHYEGTGAEIIRDLPEVSHVVCGIGTGGTITGVGKRLKEYKNHRG
jgi:cysteine synthase B